MKTAEELLKEKGITPETVHHNYAYVYRVVCDLIGEAQKEGYKEATRWRDPKEELPEVGMKVLVKTSNGKYSVTEMYIYKDSIGTTLGAEWRGSYDFRMSIIGWRPIE